MENQFFNPLSQLSVKRVNGTELSGSCLLETINSTHAKIAEIFGEWNEGNDEKYGEPLDLKIGDEFYSIYSKYGSYRIGGFEKGQWFNALKTLIQVEV